MFCVCVKSVNVFIFLTANECQEILLNEVISVQAVHTSPSKFRRINGNIKYVAVEMQSVRPVAFIVHMIKRSSKCRLKCKDVTFSCKDHHTCEQWINKIKEILFAPGVQYFDVSGCLRFIYMLVFNNNLPFSKTLFV